ncbi:hypothetical protein [Pseudomonas nitroreducens]|uniref:hypothetical protein n=1 Tax=Pseudomonas nitroreducens TaxID=46680 RepID=UPI000B6D2F6D|nr:hypothetical protein [Pseudomonas nitroreducens]NMZ58175.1 hypothetical protein [Pseudomonas nitroreducens]SNS12500.1 hypothetical protein SAMN05216209_1401 [Pseudomonas nitroreducens]
MDYYGTNSQAYSAPPYIIDSKSLFTSGASGRKFPNKKPPATATIIFNTGHQNISTGARPFNGGRIRVLINDVVFETSKIEFKETPIESTSVIASPTTTSEKLSLLQSSFGISITQMSDILGVTRKTIYDWIDGSEPRPASSQKIDILTEISERHSNINLSRLKTVWNIPINGKSLRQVLAEDSTDRTGVLEDASAKIAALAPKLGAPSKPSKAKIRMAHLSDIDRASDVG